MYEHKGSMVVQPITLQGNIVGGLSTKICHNPALFDTRLKLGMIIPQYLSFWNHPGDESKNCQKFLF